MLELICFPIRNVVDMNINYTKMLVCRLAKRPSLSNSDSFLIQEEVEESFDCVGDDATQCAKQVLNRISSDHCATSN